jgi:broad specificity phosphatase PhoE
MDCETVALFCHGGWLCGLLDTVLETRVPRKNYLCGNCTIGIFEVSGNVWKLHSWMNL